MDEDRTKKPGQHDPLQDAVAYHNYAAVGSASTNKLTLALDVRRGLIGVSTVAAVVVIAGLTVFFQHGFELRTYNGAGMTPKQRNELLDKWNGYSGNAAAAIGRPLEMVIAMTAQLLVLRFLANAMLQPKPKWPVATVAIAVSAVLGFLLNNGFNALNVQLRDGAVTAVIQASDLEASTLASTMNATAITNITQTFAETQPANSIANTVLRGVVLPRPMKAQPQCDPSPPDVMAQEDSVSYGFQQQDWMKYVLPQALSAKKLRVLLNATDADANKALKSADLPMNASRAADLFVIATIVSPRYIPWGKSGEWEENITAEAYGNRKTGTDAVPTGIAAGLLPPQAAASELEQKEYFVRAAQKFFNNRRMNTSATSQANVEIEFAHVDVSPSISLDSMTWRVELNPSALTQLAFAANKSRYGFASCGPWPGVCSVQRLENEPTMVVHAFSACANDDGSETLQTIPFTGGSMREFNIQCPRRSNASIILLSAGRKLVADAVLANTRANSTMLIPDNGQFTVLNPRKFYSFAISRLGWTAQDLATKFRAMCESPRGCMGLDMETTNGKTLVAGLSSLPLDGLVPVAFDITTNSEALSPYRLITVNESPWKISSASTRKAGDYLLAHNVASNNMNRTRQAGIACSTYDEDRQQLVLNNHLYLESTLQTTYTAGVFFLFQSAALRDKVPVSKTNAAPTLAFDGNVVRLSLWISIPTWNALLTGAGCVLLAVGFLSAMVWSSRGRRGDAPDTMEAITTAHVIARVMLDDASFPPSVVRRRVVNDSAGNVAPGDTTAASLVDNFYIESLTLKSRDETKDRAAGFV